MEARMEMLEMKIAYQDHTLNQLNEVVTQLQMELMGMRQKLEEQQRIVEMLKPLLRPDSQ